MLANPGARRADSPPHPCGHLPAPRSASPATGAGCNPGPVTSTSAMQLHRCGRHQCNPQPLRTIPATPPNKLPATPAMLQSLPCCSCGTAALPGSIARGAVAPATAAPPRAAAATVGSSGAELAVSTRRPAYRSLCSSRRRGAGACHAACSQARHAGGVAWRPRATCMVVSMHGRQHFECAHRRRAAAAGAGAVCGPEDSCLQGGVLEVPAPPHYPRHHPGQHRGHRHRSAGKHGGALYWCACSCSTLLLAAAGMPMQSHHPTLPRVLSPPCRSRAAPSAPAPAPLSSLLQLIDWALLPRAMLGVLALLCGNGYIVGINQIYDVDIDAVNKPFLPVAAGELSPGTAWLLCLALAAGACPPCLHLPLALRQGRCAMLHQGSCPSPHPASHPLPTLPAACICCPRDAQAAWPSRPPTLALSSPPSTPLAYSWAPSTRCRRCASSALPWQPS